jgi:hypothetical protein
MLVEVAAAAYFGKAQEPRKAAPASSPRSKAQKQPRRSLPAGEAAQSPGTAAQQAAAKGPHAQDDMQVFRPHAGKPKTPQTSARGRSTARKPAKPWWVV